MDQISLKVLVLSSFPDEIIAAVIGILCIGKLSFFKDKKNYIRFLVYSVLLAVASYFIRRNVNSEAESGLVNIILSALLFIFILRLKYYEAILAAIFGAAACLITEIFVLVPYTAITGIDLGNVYGIDSVRLIVTIPIRAVQVLLIFLMVRFNFKIFDLDKINIRQKEFYIQVFTYALSILALLFLALIMAKVLLVDHNNMANSASIILLRLNVYISLFVTIILTLAIRNTNDHFKFKSTLNNNEFSQSLDYILDLLGNKNYLEAKKAVENLKEHINSNYT